MAMNFTQDQQKVIDTRGKNILVSASAGSGKTAVLVARIMKKVCEEGIDIDRLLIVTFTNAAAAEMRERIHNALLERIEEEPENEHLQKQLVLLMNAQITTIHSFCLYLVRNHFEKVDIDPTFRLGDEGEMKLLKNDVLDEMLEEHYSEGTEGFLQMIEALTSSKRDENIKEYILSIYEFAMSYPWPKQWLFDSMKQYNENQRYPVIHINTTFETMANAIGEILDDRDYDMQDVLADYLNYCYTDGLIPVSDAWKYMRMQLAGATFDFNIRANVYYDKAERGFRAHDTLALYKNKSVRAIGKVIARITAIETEDGIKYNVEYGELTDEKKEVIAQALADGDSHGYDLRTIEHRYFFVEKFYETDFKKVTPRAPMGTRIFDLTQVLGTDNIPDTEELAQRLMNENWS